jgi:hypothetical protein
VSISILNGVVSILEKVLAMDYEYLSRRCDAVESLRMKLRGYILVVNIAETL